MGKCAPAYTSAVLPKSEHFSGSGINIISGFELVTLASLERFNTDSTGFQLFVSSVPFQCVPAESPLAAFTWHCPGSMGKKREKLPFYPRLLPWKPTNGRDIKTVIRRESLWATLAAWLLYFRCFFLSLRFPALLFSLSSVFIF